MKGLQKTGLLVATCATFLMTTNDASARPAYASNVPSTTATVCSTCHIDGQPKQMRNAFGADLQTTLNGGSWADIYDKDSDGDGYTNGQELGDPDGMWKMGDANTTFVSEPGQASSSPCGNGVIDNTKDGEEECDGAELGGKTCADFGGDAAKAPTCSSTCTIDSSSCNDTSMDMGMDMTDTDMSMDMDSTDMDSADMDPADMDSNDMDSADMDSTDMANTDDMGSTDMGTTPTPTPKEDDEEGGCASTGTNGVPAGGALTLLGLLGMIGLRRRRH